MELRDLLLARGIERCPAFASALNRSWREPGWMVMDVDDSDLGALTTRFRQVGMLWWSRGDAVRPCLAAGRPDDIDLDARSTG